MASNLTKKDSSYFIGCPIVFEVNAHSEPIDAVVTFHRVVLKVTIGSYSQELSMPVTSGQQGVEFDISSVFRAYAEKDVYEPISSSTSFPVYNATLEARDVWMREGVLVDPAPSNAAIATASCSAIRGKFSDLERLKGTVSYDMSRKPTDSPEIVCVGDNVVYGVMNPISGSNPIPYGQSLVKSIQSTDENKVVAVTNFFDVFALPSSLSRHSRQFQFVNSRGVVESIRAWALETSKMKSKNAEYTISRIETFSKFARTLIHKQANHEEISLCSGFVTYEWAKWWADEFCQSEHHWMLHEGKWIPCNVTIDDTATIIDRTKSQMCYVSFVCRPNINGILR